MKNELQQLQQHLAQPARYMNVDGTFDLGWGTMLLCCALSSYMSIGLPPVPPWRQGVCWLLLAFGALAPLLVPGMIKRHITSPRTGYIVHRRDTKSARIGIVVAVIVAVGISVSLTSTLVSEIQPGTQHGAANQDGLITHNAAINRAQFLLLAGFLTNAPLYFTRSRASMREQRWKWLLLAAMVLGTLGIGFTVPGNFWLLMLFLGLVWLLSGGATLYLYLRHTQPPAPEAA